MLRFNERRYFRPEVTPVTDTSGAQIDTVTQSVPEQLDQSTNTEPRSELADQIKAAENPNRALEHLAADPEAKQDSYTDPIDPELQQQLDAQELATQITPENTDNFFSQLAELEKKGANISSHDVMQLIDVFNAAGGDIDKASLANLIDEINDLRKDSTPGLIGKIANEKVQAQKWASTFIKNGIPIGAAALALGPAGPITALIIGLSARYYMALQLNTDRLQDRIKFNDTLNRNREMIGRTWEKCTNSTISIIKDIRKYQAKLEDPKLTEGQKSQLAETITALKAQLKDVMVMTRDTAAKLADKIETMEADETNRVGYEKLAMKGDKHAISMLRSGAYRTSNLIKDLGGTKTTTDFEQQLINSGFTAPELAGTKSLKDYAAPVRDGDSFIQSPERVNSFKEIADSMRAAYQR